MFDGYQSATAQANDDTMRHLLSFIAWVGGKEMFNHCHAPRIIVRSSNSLTMNNVSIDKPILTITNHELTIDYA